MENFTKREAAEFLRVSLAWVDRAMKRGEITAAKVGRRVIFRRATLETFLERCEQKARRRARDRAQKVA